MDLLKNLIMVGTVARIGTTKNRVFVDFEANP